MHLWDFSTPQSTSILLHIKKEYVPAYALCTANCLFRSLYEHCTFIAHELYVDSNLQERYWFISSKSRRGQRKNSGWKGEGCWGSCAECCRLSAGRAMRLPTSWKAAGGWGSSIYVSVGLPHQSEEVRDIQVSSGWFSPFAVPLVATLLYSCWGCEQLLLLCGEGCGGAHLAGLGFGQDWGRLGIRSGTVPGAA